MKNMIIIGAGGMGRTLYDMAKEALGYNSYYEIKGFIDDNTCALDNFDGYPKILSTIIDYQPREDDIFICSMGGEIRKKCINMIIGRGGLFFTLIHRTARIGSNVILGEGNLIGAFTTIAADVAIGDYNFIQSYAIIGHDVRIGSWNRIDSHVMCVGGIKIGNENMIHTSAVINHNVTIGDYAHIGACSFVSRNVESNTTVFGNPARRLM